MSRSNLKWTQQSLNVGLDSILQKRVKKIWSNFGERPAWQVGGSELGVNYHHLPLDQGLGGTAMAGGRALGTETWLTSLLSPCTWAGAAAPSRGEWKGICSLCWTPAGRASRGWLWFPPEASTPLTAPKAPPAAGLTRGWGMLDTWVAMWMGCVLLFHRGFHRKPTAPLEWTWHPLLQKPQLVNVTWQETWGLRSSHAWGTRGGEQTQGKFLTKVPLQSSLCSSPSPAALVQTGLQFWEPLSRGSYTNLGTDWEYNFPGWHLYSSAQES